MYAGKRLSFDGQLCTVRYHGEVKGTKGEWLGVEWDDPTRGKHSGENGGIRYFECLSKEPTAASFIRPNRKPDTPRSFVEALRAKYASEKFEDPDVQIVFSTHPGDNSEKNQGLSTRLNQPVRISGKEVEEVGFDKIRKQLAELSELKIVILDGLCMERPIARLQSRDDTTTWPLGLSDIKDVCPKVIELDLSRNLFEEWREVGSICEQLANLRSLRVDGIRLRDTSLTEQERTHCRTAFAQIKYLELDSTLLPWEEIVRITQDFPSLTTFVASSNFYTSLPPNHTLNPNITDLSLEDNLLPNLSTLSPVTKLPNLRRLILKSNKISSIAGTSHQPLIFPETVTEVDLSYNEIITWSFIDALPTVFPGLTSLRVSHNPLYTDLQAPDGRLMSPEDGYMLTIARFGNIKVLNYSPISEKERLNAESYYLSLIAKEVSFAPEEEEQRILDSHPRYKWLCDEYGAPNFQRGINQINPNSLAARLMRIKLYQAGGKSWEMEIPMNSTAYTLLGIASKQFGIKPMKCRLVWETGDWMSATHSGELDNDDWDSESDDERVKSALDSVRREVEIVPGTRSVGTWIEGKEATVRVETK